MLKKSIRLTGNLKFAVENVSKNCLLIQQKYSVVINCLSFQLNHSLNIFLADNASYVLVLQQKHFDMVILQNIKETYGDNFYKFTGVTPEVLC